MLIFKMAFRNLWRRKFRTLITLFVIGFSFGLLLFFQGLATGSHEQIANLGIKLKSGHIVVQEKGYQKEKVLDIRIENPTPIIQKIKKTLPTSTIFTRIFTTGALRSSEGTIILNNLIAISPEEKTISDLPKKLQKGSLFSNRNGQKEIIIGKKTAKILNISVGDKVVLAVSGIDGKVEELFRIKGIFSMGGDTDLSTAFIPLKTAQNLLSLDRGVSQIAIFIDNIENSEKVATKLHSLLKNKHLEVLNWKESLPTLYQILWLDSISMYIFLLIIFGIVAAGILNTILMSVMERTKEFGILKSIGMKPSFIFTSIMTEALFLGVLAILSGLLIGLPLYYYTYKYGLDPKVISGEGGISTEGISFTDKMYSKLYLSTAIWSTITVISLTLISALYPALRASKILPVKALKD